MERKNINVNSSRKNGKTFINMLKVDRRSKSPRGTLLLVKGIRNNC